MQTLQGIKELLDENRLNEALEALNHYIISFPRSDEAYFMRGNLYRRLGDMRQALNNFCEAIAINPNSKATEAYRATQEILSFYNTDLYNP